MTLDENDDSSAWNLVRSEGSFDLCHFLSAALRLVCNARRVSLSQWWDWEDRAGLVDSGHRLSRHELSVEQRDPVASLTSREENVLEVGRLKARTEEKRVGDRLRQKETIGVEAKGLLGRLTLN